MNVILHLGGNLQRGRTAADLAKWLPDAKIVVSSEDGDIVAFYQQQGIDKSRLIIDNAAWDTVTNFTHTYKLSKSLNCSRLFVVTDFFHCYRASTIAFAVWGGRVPLYVVPHEKSLRPSDESYTCSDFFRALAWRLFGLLVFSKKVRKERQPNYPANDGHARWEIGF